MVRAVTEAIRALRGVLEALKEVRGVATVAELAKEGAEFTRARTGTYPHARGPRRVSASPPPFPVHRRTGGVPAGHGADFRTSQAPKGEIPT